MASKKTEIKIVKKANLRSKIRAIKGIKNSLMAKSNTIIYDIQERTKRGTDANGKKFRQYSKEYKKSSGKHQVNLVNTHAMLHGIDAKTIKNGIRLFFPETEEAKKAYKNQVTYKRYFLGLDKKQKKQLSKQLGKIIVKS